MSKQVHIELTEDQKKMGAKILTNPEGQEEVYYPVKVGIRKIEWYPASYLCYMNSKNA